MKDRAHGDAMVELCRKAPAVAGWQSRFAELFCDSQGDGHAFVSAADKRFGDACGVNLFI